MRLLGLLFGCRDTALRMSWNEGLRSRAWGLGSETTPGAASRPAAAHGRDHGRDEGASEPASLACAMDWCLMETAGERHDAAAGTQNLTRALGWCIEGPTEERKRV